MRAPITGIAVAMFVIVFGWLFQFTNQFQGQPSATIGSLTVPANQQANVRSLVNRTVTATTARYDSLDSPRGTTFTVPAGQTFIITAACGVDISAGGGGVIDIGYGDDAVANSAAPPTNAVTLATVFCGVFGGSDQELWLEIPAGKVPFAFAHVPAPNTWQASASGVLR